MLLCSLGNFFFFYLSFNFLSHAEYLTVICLEFFFEPVLWMWTSILVGLFQTLAPSEMICGNQVRMCPDTFSLNTLDFISLQARPEIPQIWGENVCLGLVHPEVWAVADTYVQTLKVKLFLFPYDKLEIQVLHLHSYSSFFFFLDTRCRGPRRWCKECFYTYRLYASVFIVHWKLHLCSVKMHSL